MKPNFIHVGVPKSGSGTLEGFFRAHPEIYIPRPKELDFFSDESNYKKGIQYYEDNFYSNSEHAIARGDLSIGYTTGLGSKCAKRIKEHLGSEVKFIFTLRNPVDRAYSQYCMARFKGQFETLDFKESIKRALNIEGKFDYTDVIKIQNGGHYSNKRLMDIYRYCMYIYPGSYAHIVEEYANKFGMKNILVLYLEDIKNAQQDCLDTISDFIGVKQFSYSGEEIRNESTSLKYPAIKRVLNRIYGLGIVRKVLNGLLPDQTRRNLKRTILSKNYTVNKNKPKMDSESALILQNYYAEDLLKFEQMVGKDLSHWKNKYQI